MSRFTTQLTHIEGLLIVERQRVEDERGFLCRMFCQETFADLGYANSIAQINHTMTRHRGTIRGMHFQRAPHADSKFVSCLTGAVFDVAVDTRPESPTYLQWQGAVLSAENNRSLLIPAGFAHGFQSLEDDAQLLYLHGKPYAPLFEGGLNALDPRLSIPWPLPVTHMSDRDRGFPIITG
ncbi:MAG: dTDP-4-dehydrorhamnose 3,5-epimerase [Rhodomicrobium sp.]